MKENTFRAEQKMQYIIEQFWLLYFNQFLFERGLITEEERNRMANRINNRIHPMKSLCSAVKRCSCNTNLPATLADTDIMQ
jgi:hypothetical protein